MRRSTPPARFPPNDNCSTITQATKGACDNKLLVRRTLVERIILEHLKARLSSSEAIHYVLRRVEEEVGKLYAYIPDTLRLKVTELHAEERRLANFVDFIGEGRGSRTLAQTLVETERKVDALKEELEGLRRSRDKIFQASPREWVEERLAQLKDVLERNPDRSGLLLRKFLGPLCLDPMRSEANRRKDDFSPWRKPRSDGIASARGRQRDSCSGEGLIKGRGTFAKGSSSTRVSATQVSPRTLARSSSRS